MIKLGLKKVNLLVVVVVVLVMFYKLDGAHVQSEDGVVDNSKSAIWDESINLEEFNGRFNQIEFSCFKKFCFQLLTTAHFSGCLKKRLIAQSWVWMYLR